MSRYLIFGTAGLALLLYSMSMSSLSVAFPAITSSFDASLVLAGWVLSIYQLAATASMPLAGKAGDMFGRKLVFIITLILFIVASFLCIIAPNIYLLIAFRFLQAIGGGSFLPLSAGIVAEAFPKSRHQAIGLFSSILPLGQLIGPNLGGWMTVSFGWRSLFWVNIPFGIIVLIASIFLLSSRGREEGARMDLTGAGLFTGALFAIMGGLTQIGSKGTSSWALSGLLLAIGSILVVFFVRHERRVENPIVDLEVIRDRPFIAANIFNFMIGTIVYGIMSLVPFYAVSVYGLSTLESGFVITPRSVGMAATSVLTSVFMVRWGYRLPMLIGSAFLILAIVLLGIEPSEFDILGIHVGGTAIVLLMMTLMGIGSGLTIPTANNACIELMPHRVATITGVRGMFRQTGGAISIAMFSLILENASTLAHGFTICFIGQVIVLALVVPVIFAMPRSPDSPPLAKSSPKAV